MSQISPSSQPLYGGSMPSGTTSSVSPTIPGQSIPHEGMSTDKIVWTVVGSSVAAVAIGTGIYYLTKKDKPSGKKTSATSTATQRRDGNNQVSASSSYGIRSESASRSREQVQHGNNHAVAPPSHKTRSESVSTSTVYETGKQSDDETMSSNVIAFFNALKSNPIQDVDRSFKSLNSQEKNKIRTSILKEINNIYNSDELELTKKIFFICEDGHLSPEINQAFNLKAKELALDLDELDFDNGIERFSSFSEGEQAEYINNIGKNIHLLDSNNRDMMKFYYSRFMKPKTTPRVCGLIDHW